MFDDNNSFNMYGEQPQENQYFSGSAADPNSSTQWMQPSFGNDSTLNPDFERKFDSSKANTDYRTGEQSSGLGIDQQSVSPSGGTIPLADGTAIGQVTSGWTMPSNFNIAAPLGFDAAKWSDPNQGTTLKYQAGRMAADLLSQGLAPKDITARIAQQFGAKQIADDAIQYPDGFIADLFFDVGGPNQRVQYTDVTRRGDSGAGGMGDMGNSPFAEFSAIPGFFGGQGINQGYNFGMDQNAMKELAQRLFQNYQSGRQRQLQNRAV